MLARPLAQVETAWSILQPYFGTQLTFGFGRLVPAPNFFDVVAMGVVIDLIKKPCDVNEVVQISICTAEEVAVFVDGEGLPGIFDEAFKREITNHLIASLYTPATAGQFQLLLGRKDDVVATALDVLENVSKILGGGRANQPATRNATQRLADKIA
ncbi:MULTISPECIES: hypothetical protein [unclassified Ruegeria]|uniref:hypothetical protein n=1 Tax=unclassified Ruegeria TaxID=2625375 RepID=UPI001ADAFD64|nr:MULTISPECIES: hypothetical protein [unclassified Ruegeria]MBO9410800.1 hypothetical protein [Ruegeria sp. R8_1]MBO9415001.1 hypothetical protein [Ruegeria sp. R8_2]